jgi:hypothetical protein
MILTSPVTILSGELVYSDRQRSVVHALLLESHCTNTVATITPLAKRRSYRPKSYAFLFSMTRLCLA